MKVPLIWLVTICSLLSVGSSDQSFTPARKQDSYSYDYGALDDGWLRTLTEGPVAYTKVQRSLRELRRGGGGRGGRGSFGRSGRSRRGTTTYYSGGWSRTYYYNGVTHYYSFG